MKYKFIFSCIFFRPTYFCPTYCSSIVLSWLFFKFFITVFVTHTVWKVSVFGVILVRIFPHSDGITPNTDTFYAVSYFIVREIYLSFIYCLFHHLEPNILDRTLFWAKILFVQFSIPSARHTQFFSHIEKSANS